MARRSVRLLESGYYRGDGTPTVSYRETLPRTRYHCVWYDANQYVENAHPAETETSNTRPHDTSHRTRTRTGANTAHSGSAGVVRLFFLCFLLFVGMATMYFQLRGAQRDISTLRRLVVECQDNVGFLQGRVFFIQYGFIVKSLWDGFFFWV